MLERTRQGRDALQIAKDRIIVVFDPVLVVFNVVFAVTVLAFWLVGCIFLVVVVLVANVPAFMLFHPLVHSVLVLLFYFMFSPEAE